MTGGSSGGTLGPESALYATFLGGFLANTVFISLYLRPKIAAAKAGMLNFYWMFLALITGVYTFGLVGIIIGPTLIGVL